MKNCLYFAILILVAHTCNGDTNATFTTHDESRNVSRFEEATKSPYFVDKTSLIKKFFKSSYTVITSPKNFGKSTNLDMLRRFFELPIDEAGQPIDRKSTRFYKLFTNKSLNLEISKDKEFIEEHFGKYPVLYLDFSNITGNTLYEIYNSTLQKMLNAVAPYIFLYHKVKQQHEATNNTELLRRVRCWKNFINETRYRHGFLKAMETVTEAIQDHFRKPLMVFVDNYDKPYIRALNKWQYVANLEEFMRNIVRIYTTVTDQASHVMAVGVFRYFMNRPVPVLAYYYFLDNHIYAEYFGFTGTEVDRLLDANKIDIEDKKKIKKYFNGYTLKENRVHKATRESLLYNPKGVLRYLQNRTFDDYGLMDDNITTTLMKCIRHETFFIDIIKLLKMKSVNLPAQFHMLETEVIDFENIVRGSCVELSDEFPYLLPFLDNGYLAYAHNSYHLSNKVAKEKLKRDFQRAYLDLYGINIVNSRIASSLQSTLNSNITTNEILTTLRTSLQDILQPRIDNSWEYSLTSYEFRSIIIGILYSNLDFYEDIVRVSEIGWKTETVFNHLEMLKLPSHDKKTVLIINVSFKKSLNDSIEEARKYVPYGPQNASMVKLVKYIGINFNEDNKIELEKGENRDHWNWTSW